MEKEGKKNPDGFGFSSQRIQFYESSILCYRFIQNDEGLLPAVWQCIFRFYYLNLIFLMDFTRTNIILASFKGAKGRMLNESSISFFRQ